MRDRACFATIACLLGVAVLTGACGTASTSAPIITQMPTAQDSLPLTSETAYPPPPQTAVPTPLPTATPLPTSLPLPPPPFDILWTENGPYPLETSGVIWRADPRDVAARQEIVRFDRKEIYEAALSPNGRLLAISLKPRSIWLANLDGTDLHEISSIGGQIRWSQDSLSIFYDVGGEDWVGIERIDVKTGNAQRIFTVERDYPSIDVLGLSAGGRWIYFLLTGTEGGELWQAKTDGSTSSLVASLGTDLPEPSRILLSPRGSKVLIAASRELRWVSTDGREKGKIPLPQPGQGYQVLWGYGPNEENEVIVGQILDYKPPYHLYTVDIPPGQARELVTIDIPSGPGWDQLSLSPDGKWLMAYLWSVGYYWIHLPTKTMIPVPCQDCSMQFVAWVPKGAGQ